MPLLARTRPTLPHHLSLTPTLQALAKKRVLYRSRRKEPRHSHGAPRYNFPGIIVLALEELHSSAFKEAGKEVA